MANNIDNKDNHKPDINCNQLQLDVPKCDANKVVGNIEHLIKIIRGQQVMLDKDLAMLYGVETRALNQAVKRNIQRFPADFRFQLTMEECSKSQIVTLNTGRGQNIKKLPYAFTEQGVAMLSSVLLFYPIHRASEDTPFSFYLPHPQTFSKNSLHLSEEKRIFAAECCTRQSESKISLLSLAQSVQHES